MDKECVTCGKLFAAKRSTAKFCSAACKMKYTRLNEDPTTLSQDVSEEQDDEWFESAKHKTQEEIEAHYTLANFPNRARYYSGNGGGSGALSPYRSDDLRHQAYLSRQTRSKAV